MTQPDLSSEELLKMLHAPAFGIEIPPENVYRSACAGAITMLTERRDFAALSDVVLNAPAEDSRTRALYALCRSAKTGNSEAVHQLFLLTIYESHEPSAELLRHFDFKDESPEWNSAKYLLLDLKDKLKKADPGLALLTRLFEQGDEKLRHRLLALSAEKEPHWHLFAEFLNSGSEKARQELRKNYPFFTDAGKKLIKQVLPKQKENIANLAADLYLDSEDEELRQLCLSRGLLPSDERRIAHFAFLTEQWELYDEKDSGYRAIRQAFDEADAEGKRRLISTARHSGHTAWLAQLDASVLGQKRDRFSLSEWQALIHTLAENNDFGKLWELLPTVPFVCMREICGLLNGFEPEQPEERAFFNELKQLISQAPELVPLPFLRELNPAGTPAVSIAVNGDLSAVSFTNRSIRVFDGEREQPLISSRSMNFRKLCIHPAGNLLAADCGDGNIAVFSLPGGNQVKLISAGKQPLCGLSLSSDGKRLTALDVSGKISVFSFPNGTLIGTLPCGIPQPYRSSYDPQRDQLTAMDMNGMLSVIDLPRLQLLTKLQICEKLNAAVEFHSQNCFSGVDGQNRLFCRNLHSGLDLISDIPCGSSSRILRISDLVPGELSAVGNADGEIILLNAASGKHLAQTAPQTAGASPLIGIVFDSDRNSLYALHANGYAQLMDMKLFIIMCGSFDLLHLPELREIDKICEKYSADAVRSCGDWIRSVIRWRRRFDIEVDFDFF